MKAGSSLNICAITSKIIFCNPSNGSELQAGKAFTGKDWILRLQIYLTALNSSCFKEGWKIRVKNSIYTIICLGQNIPSRQRNLHSDHLLVGKLYTHTHKSRCFGTTKLNLKWYKEFILMETYKKVVYNTIWGKQLKYLVGKTRKEKTLESVLGN